MWRKDAFAGGFSFALGAAILTGLLYVGWQVLQAAFGIATPFLGGVVVAVLLDPVVDRIQRQWAGGRRLPAVILVFTAFLAVFVGLVAFVAPTLVTQTQALVTWFTPMSYTVLRAPSAGGPYTTLTSGLVTTTYVVHNLDNGTPYYFKIVSTDSRGRERRIGPGPVEAIPGVDAATTRSRGSRATEEETGAPSWGSSASASASPSPSPGVGPGASRRVSPFSLLFPRRRSATESPSPSPAASAASPSPSPSPSPPSSSSSPATTEAPRPTETATGSPDPPATPVALDGASSATPAAADDAPEPDGTAAPAPTASPLPDRGATGPRSDRGRPGDDQEIAMPSAAATSDGGSGSSGGDADSASGGTSPEPAESAPPSRGPDEVQGAHAVTTTRKQSATAQTATGRPGGPVTTRQVRTTTTTTRQASTGGASPPAVDAATAARRGILVTPGDGSVVLHWRAPTEDVHGIDRIRVSVDEWLAAHHKIGPIALPASFEAVTAQYSDQVTQALRVSASRVGDIIVASVSRLISIILIPIVTFYVLADIDRLRGRLLFLLPEGARSVVQSSAMDIGAVFGGYVRGMLIVSLSYGLVTMVVFALPLQSYALLLGVAAGVLYIVPYLGPLVTALLAVILSLITGHEVGATLLFLALILAQNQIFDNVVVPRVVGKSVGLHPLLTLFALLLGGTLFGLWGMLLSVPIAASIQVILFRLYPKLAAPTPLSSLMDTEAKEQANGTAPSAPDRSAGETEKKT